MIWLSWRQLRIPVLTVYPVLAVIAILLAITGPHLADLLHDYGRDFFTQLGFETFDRRLYLVAHVAVYALPAVIGAFWGAPMVARELEAGTHRLVWNQSLTRTQWLAAKLAGALGAAVLAALISFAVMWWSRPIDTAINKGYGGDGGGFGSGRLSGEIFGASGVVPIGYTVLALVLGVTIGLVLRRTMPAIAVTLIAVVAIQVAVPIWIAPHLLAPKTTDTTITSENVRNLSKNGRRGPIADIGIQFDQPGAWIVSNRTVDSSGKPVSPLPDWTGQCEPEPPGPSVGGPWDACLQRLASEGYRQEVSYQPASRYWTLQWLTTAGLLGLSVLLTGFSFWWLRRRVT
jgi:hypothetical protein